MKRRLQIGTRLEMTYSHACDPGHSWHGVVTLPNVRRIVKAQTNAVALSAPTDGAGALLFDWPSWVWWKGAKSVRIESADTFSILDPDGVRIGTYRILAEGDRI